jgi:hypothetical protein
VDVNMPPSTCAIIGGGISATANTCAAARKGRGAAERKGGGYLIVLPRDLLDRLKAMRALARATPAMRAACTFYSSSSVCDAGHGATRGVPLNNFCD